MKTRNWQMVLAVMAVASLTLSTATVLAQNSLATSTGQTAAANASAVPLSYGLTQVLQLSQAKVGDSTIIAYIKNSGNSYDLSADQIIYLRQQGLSDAVLTTMLSQPRPGLAVAAPTTPAPPPEPVSTPAVVTSSTVTPAAVATTTVAPTVTYVQTVPANTYYYSQPYYYPTYAWFPPVSFSFGWGGGWHGGGWHH